VGDRDPPFDDASAKTEIVGGIMTFYDEPHRKARHFQTSLFRGVHLISVHVMATNSIVANTSITVKRAKRMCEMR
jgi:hypothetical protein